MRSKEYRLHKEATLKKKRSAYWDMSRENVKTERRVGIALHTPCVCSCYVCGNERKYYGKRTIQERRLFQDLDLCLK